MAKKKTRAEELQENLQKDFQRWEYLNTHGGSDPLYEDGFNMNIGGVKDNTDTKAEKEEEINESITAQEFVKKMQEKPHSRNDSLFGTGWKKEPEKTEEPQDMEHPDGYKGFLYIKCDKCGKEKGFCAKEKIKSYKCECGKETELVNLKPLYTKCKCGNEFKYMTNMNTAEFTYKCFTCGNPVDVKMNSRRTAYITIGGGY